MLGSHEPHSFAHGHAVLPTSVSQRPTQEIQKWGLWHRCPFAPNLINPPQGSELAASQDCLFKAPPSQLLVFCVCDTSETLEVTLPFILKDTKTISNRTLSPRTPCPRKKRRRSTIPPPAAATSWACRPASAPSALSRPSVAGLSQTLQTLVGHGQSSRYHWQLHPSHRQTHCARGW